MANPSTSSEPVASAAHRVDLSADFFAILGVSRGYDLDREQLEQRYLELAAAVHPDRVASGSSSERRQAMERSAAVNEAYRTLRDPVKRAEYLIKLRGIDLDSSDPETGAPEMEQSFLVEMIERRETLDEARASGTGAMRRAVEQIEDELEESLDAAIDALHQGRSREAAQALVRRRYLERLLAEAEGDGDASL